jgi:hypothetical protein
MDALDSRSRIRLAPFFEWLIAVLFLAATVSVGAMIVNELKGTTTRRQKPIHAASLPTADLPPAVPARAVSVPVLPLPDGKELKVGDMLSAVAERLGRAAESGRQDVDRGSFGERLTRFYEYAGSRFILVFERAERDGEMRVAAIYLQ